jgi:hypothetical protein
MSEKELQRLYDLLEKVTDEDEKRLWDMLFTLLKITIMYIKMEIELVF